MGVIPIHDASSRGWLKAREVTDLGNQAQGGQCLDGAERSQPLDLPRPALLAGELLMLTIWRDRSTARDASVPRQQQADRCDGQAEPGRHEEDQVVPRGEGGGRGAPAGLHRGSGAGGRREHRQAYRPTNLAGGVGQAADGPASPPGTSAVAAAMRVRKVSPMPTAMSSVGPSTPVAGGLWQEGKLADKPVTAFTSAFNRHGGSEATILSLGNVFYHWGALIVPPGFTDPVVSAAGGNPYGNVTGPTGDGPDGTALEAARYQGRRLAEITIRLLGGSRVTDASAGDGNARGTRNNLPGRVSCG